MVYTHNMKTHKIKTKDLDVLNKWTKGAMARRRFVKLVLTKSIQSKFIQNGFIYLFIFRFEIPMLQRTGNQLN